jgi:hypothetical protein
MAQKQTSPQFNVGDRVKILHSDNWQGRIVELRGPLGTGGLQIYRLRILQDPKPSYIEVGEDQIVAIPAPPKVKASPPVSHRMRREQKKE